MINNKKLILICIKQIEDYKKEMKKEPSFALYVELSKKTNLDSNELKQCLNELYQDGEIEVGNTLNDKWIRIKK